MFQEHMLPMLQVEDKKTGDIITQVFNFIDNMHTENPMSVETIESMLQQRGILEPPSKFANQKHSEVYEMTNQSSFLNDNQMESFNQEVDELNQQLVENTEQKIDIVYDADTINYKNEILDAFRQNIDPYNVEIGEGEFDYE